MTATLVLGGPCSGRSRHAEALLARHPQVTFVTTHAHPDPEADPELSERVRLQQERRPAGWRTVETLDLTRALLGSRHPVVIDDLGGWLRGVLGPHPVTEGLEEVRSRVEERLDELSVALRAVPFDVVTVSHDPSSPRLPEDPAERLYAELLSRVNQRVSAASARVLVIVGGRVVDLSDAPLLGSV